MPFRPTGLSESDLLVSMKFVASMSGKNAVFWTGILAQQDRARDLHPNLLIGYRKTHTSLKCVNRSRSAPAEGRYNFQKTAMSSDIEVTHLIEMRKSLSLCPCRAIIPFQKTTMSSGIEFTHFIETYKSLLLGPCRVNTHKP